jgi:arabinose-5-phosphate isomerase
MQSIIDIKEVINNVIDTEQAGISDLKSSIHNVFKEDFITVCNLIKDINGRVVLTGVGKSGYIANKISATLSSTGTKSFYIHPTEALHGDLGAIDKNDLVIALSNSGNSSELKGIVSYCNRFNIPLVGISQNKDSYLAINSNYNFIIPKVKEACPLGIAPTTSSTVMLVLGDVIAVLLMHLKGFTKEQFSHFHPGGSIGISFNKISDIMIKNKNLPIATKDTTFIDCLTILSKYRLGCICIIDANNTLLGVLTDKDIRDFILNNNNNPNIFQIPASHCMNINFTHVNADLLVLDALTLFNKASFNHLFITDENKKLQGLLHIQDLFKTGVI